MMSDIRAMPRLDRVALLALMLAGVPAVAQVAGPVVDGPAADLGAERATAWVESRIAALESDSLDARDRAMLELSNDARLTSRNVEKLLARTDLSAEQRERLSSVGLARFRQEPRAAMGVSFDRGLVPSEGVTIRGAIAGFDAARVLQGGDVILAMDGLQVRTDAEARNFILSHQPGEEITLRVLRRGEPVLARVKLGSLRDLRDGPVVDPTSARRLWQYRLEKLVPQPTAGPLIDAGLTEMRWEAIAQHARNAEEGAAGRATSGEAATDSVPSVGGGGSSREPKAEATIRFSSDVNAAHAEVASIRGQLEVLQEDMRKLQVRMMDPKLAADDRNRLRVNIDVKVRQYKMLSEQLRRQAAVVEK